MHCRCRFAGREMVAAMRFTIFAVFFISGRIDTTNLITDERQSGPRRKESIKILVIEDDPTHLKLAKLVLSAAGHNVSDAEAAEQALDAIKQEKPDVILLDLVLPDMDGLTLVRKLKADPETRAIPVVAVTAYLDRFKEKDALAAGCEAYLVKPIDTRKLPRVISDVAKTAHSWRIERMV
jgi:two-component system cell cycle response regulator